MSWLLVLYTITTGKAITILPTPYPTESACKAAAKAVYAQTGNRLNATCIPGPKWEQ